MPTSKAVLRDSVSNSITGLFKARQSFHFDGREVGFSELPASVRAAAVKRARGHGVVVGREVMKQNLVVSAGRDAVAQRIVDPDFSAVIDRIQLGDTKVSGVVSKSLFPPDLSDTGLVNEIRTLLGAPGATFEIDGFSFPSRVTKTNPAGLPGTLTAGATSILTDPGADFVSDGVTDADVVTAFIGGEDFSLGIKSVLGPTQVEVENPSQLSAAGISYRITTPGGQVLIRKVVSGNNFPEALYGPMTVCHEAGLLFSNGALFNRVTISPANPEVGLVFQPQDIDGLSIGAQLDWLITI